MNQSGRIAPLLHRDLRHAGKRLAILVQRCGITDHENLRMSWHREVVLDLHPTRAIRLCLEPLARGRWRHTRSPYHGLAEDAFTRHDDALLVDLTGPMSQPYRHPQFPEPPLRGVRKVFGKTAQSPVCHVYQDDSRRGG